MQCYLLVTGVGYVCTHVWRIVASSPSYPLVLGEDIAKGRVHSDRIDSVELPRYLRNRSASRKHSIIGRATGSSCVWGNPLGIATKWDGEQRTQAGARDLARHRTMESMVVLRGEPEDEQAASDVVLRQIRVGQHATDGEVAPLQSAGDSARMTCRSQLASRYTRSTDVRRRSGTLRPRWLAVTADATLIQKAVASSTLANAIRRQSAQLTRTAS